MRLDEKARENLEAVERLLATGTADVVLPLCNAAASRAYYVAYLAVADRAQRDGRGFVSPRGYYTHDSLPDEAFNWAILSADQRDDLSWLRDLRVKADYWEDQVHYDEVSEAATIAEQFITLLDEVNP